MKSKPTDSWASLLENSLKSREKRPPGDGWKTRDEMQTIIKQGSSSTKDFLRRMVRAGVVDMFRGTQLNNSELTVQTWYRIKKGKK